MYNLLLLVVVVSTCRPPTKDMYIVTKTDCTQGLGCFRLQFVVIMYHLYTEDELLYCLSYCCVETLLCSVLSPKFTHDHIVT
jgi:hypothetical protein